jgi:hypothetical protein
VGVEPVRLTATGPYARVAPRNLRLYDCSPRRQLFCFQPYVHVPRFILDFHSACSDFRATWDQYYDFLNIFAEKFSENIGVFLLKLLLVFAKIVIITLVFEKNANFFAENWQKSPKIVIITSTPDEFAKKSRPKCSQTCFLAKLTHNFFRRRKIWNTFLILKKLSKENNRPLGENSPNLPPKEGRLYIEQVGLKVP